MKQYRSKHKRLSTKMERYEPPYVLPKWIEEKLTKEILCDYYSELVNKYNRKLTYCKDLVHIYGTYAWQDAFDKMCEKHGLTDVWKYCDNLDWYDYDWFCGYINKLVVKYRIATYY